MRFVPSLTALAGLIGFVAPAVAAPAPAAKKLPVEVANGGFERSFMVENPWNGVNSKGALMGFRATAPVLAESGAISNTAMPMSVAVADMNGDGKADIVSTDARGYLRIFFNEGGAEGPKFVSGDIASLYLSVPVVGLPDYSRGAPRVTVVPGTTPQVLVGNYYGEILKIGNQGNGQKPAFTQPADFARIEIPTVADTKQRWGNVFAPAMWDWNGDGKMDLLIGEGSYSANNIHLALNQGSDATPRFSEAERHVIAYGMGREQLTPAVVDWNGDGKPDLLVASRDGKIAVHLHPNEPWKPGVVLDRTSFVTVGGPTGKEMTFGGLCTVSAGDLSGDGLFDLVIGRADGTIMYALNEGTKTEPKFSAPKAFTGGTPTPASRAPSGWDIAIGLDRGNILAYATVVKNEDDATLKAPEGSGALKIGYLPNPNRVMPNPFVRVARAGNFKFEVRDERFTAEQMLKEAPSNMFLVRQKTRSRLRPGGTYTFSMKVKGSGISNGEAAVNYEAVKTLGEDRIERGERGRATVTRNEVHERKREPVAFGSSSDWREITKTFTVRFSERELNDLESTRSTDVDLVFMLEPGKGVIYIDDVKLTEKQ